MEELNRSFNFFIKDEVQKNILKFMCSISKNVYNTMMYNHSIYIQHKKDILINAKAKYDVELKIQEENKKKKKKIDPKKEKKENIKVKKVKTEKIKKEDEHKCEKLWLKDKGLKKYVLKELDFFNGIHSDKESNYNKNYTYLSSEFKKIFNPNNFNNNNFLSLKKDFLKKTKKNVVYTKPYEYENIVDDIFRKKYIGRFMFVKYQMDNKNPITIKDPILIQNVKEKKNLFSNDKIKKDKNEKGISDENIVTRYSYRKLLNNYDKLPKNVISNTMNKCYEGIKSYYALKDSGVKCNKPKFLEADGTYPLRYCKESFRINDNNLKLTVGQYIADNYLLYTNNNHIKCLNPNNEINKKYCDESVMTKIKKIENIDKIKDKTTKKIHKFIYEKIDKNDNYIIDNKYIAKDNKHIIDPNFMNIYIPDKIKDKSIKTIEISPSYNGQFIKVSMKYTIEREKYKPDIVNLKPKECISVDLGMKNFATIYNPNNNQNIISGQSILSINRYFRKKIKETEKKSVKHYKYEMKRLNIIEHYLNCIVKYFVKRYSKKKLIIIGYNKNWKNEVNLWSKTDDFYKIPYERFIKKMKNKLGNKVYLTEESYTSKCSALTLEKLDKKKKYEGKRVHRGLYKSKKGVINADLNGAINIMRKVIKLKKVSGKKIYNPKTIRMFDICF